MENTDELIYLGVQLSNNGNNLNTIITKRNKQTGTHKQFRNILKPLGKCTFECGFIWN